MIRRAEAADLPALASLMAASPLLRRYRATHDSALDSLTEALHAGDTLLVSGHPLDAVAWLTFAPRMLNGAAYLRLLLVASPGYGIGSKLLRAVEAEAAQHARHLYLLVTADNTRARAFYERHAYRLVGHLPGLVWADLDEALYHKRLHG
jgi:GNAT superfamily N-acetyltransferase